MCYIVLLYIYLLIAVILVQHPMYHKICLTVT
jgi:hypothetical protein